MKISEDSRMSGACGMWHVVVNVGKLGKKTLNSHSPHVSDVLLS